MIFFCESKKGFTLIELIFAVAVIAIIGTFSIGAISRVGRAHRVTSASDKIMATLLEARSKTLASEDSSEFGVHFVSDSYILYRGTYVENDPSNQVNVMEENVFISNLNINSGNSVHFKKITGETDNFGNITIAGEGVSETRTISISRAGSININK